jgi:kynurenine formamidase
MMAAEQRVVDLRYPIAPPTSVPVGAPRVMIDKYLDRATGDIATSEVVAFGLHSGTHVDDPMHFVGGGVCVVQLDPLALWGSAVVVDVVGDGKWLAAGPVDLPTWEVASQERIPPEDIVIIRRGYARPWPRPRDGGSLSRRLGDRECSQRAF